MRVKLTISVFASILIMSSIMAGISFDNAYAGGPGGPPDPVRVCHFGDGLWKILPLNTSSASSHIGIHTDGNGLFDISIALDGSEDQSLCLDRNLQNSLHISKFYDANVNGVRDLGEPEIADWLVEVATFDVNTDMILSSSTTLTTAWIDDIDGDVLVSEAQEENWVPTNQEVPPIKITVFDSDPTVTISSNNLVSVEGETTIQFGNVCLGDGGAHSKGFWTNKHGQALMDNDDIMDLNALNLVDDSGSDKMFGTNSDVKTWLKEARAKNMANMLSAQLASMQLNVNHGDVDPTAYVYAPGVDEFTNFVTIQDLMDTANAELGANPTTISESDDRDYQEIIKDALDEANNNTNFVQPDICPPFMAIEEPPM